MTTITRERAQEIFLGNGPEPTASEQRELARIALASMGAEPVAWTDAEELRDLRTVGFCEMFTVEPVSKDADMYRVIPLYTDSPVPERERIRREHAEWSDATFGNVGPVGPLKHLSKEALEAAADPSDPLEWADMQFLLWDAQRRAGITDEQIALAMVEKLAVNKKREWPEPKDGEPRLHIKEQSAPVIPDGWISCSERMPEDEQEVIVHNKLGYRYVSYFDEHSGLFFDMRGGNQMNCIEHILVTHWMPLPAAPEPEQS
ncbi:TPA: dATP/dGTP pyrophosphohydrolase domain-containing protein [Salmonella enterica subsp. enterica serovar Litchfield]